VHNQLQQVSAHQSTTTTSCECAQDASAQSTTSSAYNYVSASFFGLSSFLLYMILFFAKIKSVLYIYIKVALKVNIIRR
jgi:hypothetical protein